MPYKDPTSPAAKASRRRCNQRRWQKVKADPQALAAVQARGREYAQEHVEEAAVRFEVWAPQNRDKLNANSARYRKTHRTQISEHTAALRRDSLTFRLKSNLRVRLRAALKTNAKTGSAVADLGCAVPELKAHLEVQFKPGMTWKNWSRAGWHIDHIRPLASFDLTDRKQFLAACHYTNLQPLWFEDHIKKTAREMAHGN